jgi:dynein heavy chain
MDDLEAAIPQLNDALSSLDSITEGDLAEIKRYSEPPREVKSALQAVMVILSKSQEWGEIRKTLADKNFLKLLKDQVMEVDGVWTVPAESVIKKIEKFTRQDIFKPEIMEKKSKIAAKLAAWVCAIEN